MIASVIILLVHVITLLLRKKNQRMQSVLITLLLIHVYQTFISIHLEIMIGYNIQGIDYSTSLSQIQFLSTRFL